MKDTGRASSYDNDKYELGVTGLSRDSVFTRRLRDDGNKTHFYARDSAHDVTAAANLRRYPTRGVKKRDKTEQLIQRLGRMKSKAIFWLQ
jgi:hypothetical protein